MVKSKIRKTKRKYLSKKNLSKRNLSKKNLSKKNLSKLTKLPARKKSVHFLGGLGFNDQSLDDQSQSGEAPFPEPEHNGLVEGLEEGGRKTRKHKRKFKKLLCSPAKKNNIGSSCYSSSELAVIKNAFNKHHNQSTKDREKKIVAKDPEHILRELREKNAHCTTEMCWLHAVDNKDLRDKIQKEAFRPLQPAEWRSKPDAWLSNYDIDAVIQQYEAAYPDFVFLGPTPIDFDTKKADGKCVTEEICGFSLAKEWSKGKRKIGVIYNLDTSEGPGTHWVSMFIDMVDPEPYMFYFNSTAEPMPSEVRDLMDRIQEQWASLPLHKGSSHKDGKNKKLIEYTSDDKVEHQYSNTECGMYSLFFIITCLTRKVGGFKTLGSGLSREKIIEMFAGKTRIPDRYMLKFRNLYFVKV